MKGIDTLGEWIHTRACTHIHTRTHMETSESDPQGWFIVHSSITNGIKLIMPGAQEW